MALGKLKWGDNLPKALCLPNPPAKSRWKGATVEDRERWREQLFIPYPLVEGALVDSWRKLEIARSTKRSTVMLVIGETGSGKTTFGNVLAKAATAAFSAPDPERTIVPALLISAPDPCTPPELCIHILEKLGDPLPRKREKATLPAVVQHLMKECGVRVVLFDNFQDVPQKRASRGIGQVLVRMREMIDESNCLWVLLGTDEARMVIRSEAQIIRRSPYELNLSYFSMSTPAANRLFAQVLHAIDEWLPLAEKTDLVSVGPRIHIATEGIFDRIVNLLDLAWREALKAGRETVIQDDLREAFYVEHGRRPGINPFDQDFVVRRLGAANEPYELLRAK